MPRILEGLLAATMLVGLPGTVLAQPTPRTRGPCTDCLVSLPAGTDPAPLLVVLHGDGEPAGSIFDAWAAAASRRGILVFAPACPRSEGCTSSSWWRWNGDSSWLHAQVDALAGQRAIDRSRMWIAGWSGGGTWVGWHTVELEAEYAAIVIHGGGSAPGQRTCAAVPAAIYFLGGDRNPLHALTESLHEYYATTCPHPDLTWTVLAGADHPGERKALGKYREPLLDWLSSHARAAPDAGSSDAVSPAAPASAPPSPPHDGTSSFPPVSPQEPPLRGPPPSGRAPACGCDIPGTRTRAPPAGLLALISASAMRLAGRQRRSRLLARLPRRREPVGERFGHVEREEDHRE
jgi:predicted esterase